MHALPARPLDNGWRGRGCSPCADEIRTFCQPSPVGEGGSRRLTDEVSFLDKATFLFWYFSVEKSTKSHLRGLSSLLKSSFRAHELFARAMRGECVLQRAERKPAVLPLPTISAIPRVRTYHTKKPSRFVHALPARPLKNGWRGRGWSLCADGIIKISPISLCSHQDTHPNLNREVRHSLTWHSGESESALERFEPVAAAMLWSDGRGTLFARVAARRQGGDI